MEASWAVSWERGKGNPFPSPDYLSTRFTGRFFFSPTPIFSPFFHNVEPGPRLIYTWILKIKSQLTFALFAAVNHLSGPLREQTFTSTGSKGHGLLFVTGGFRSVMFVSVLQGSLLVILIVIDGSEKRKCEGGFLNFKVPRVFEKRSKKLSLISLCLCYFYVLWSSLFKVYTSPFAVADCKS